MTSSNKTSNHNHFPGSCVSPQGQFICGIHKPHFNIANLREKDCFSTIGYLPDETQISNIINFPENDVEEKNADIIYEISNPFPFRGTTYINSKWADVAAKAPENIKIEKRKPFSFQESIKNWINQSNISKEKIHDLYTALPRPLLITIAESSTDPEELVALAKTICRFVFKENSTKPEGLYFKKSKNDNSVPDIKDHILFEIIANNPFLPDVYKNAMVLVPGIQGNSEIIGDQHKEEKETHVFEYLRSNSYIPWGHFAANMSNNSIRYSVKNLSQSDMEGMRHLYYQRTYIRLAEQLDITLSEYDIRKSFSPESLENLRSEILIELSKTKKKLEFNRSLWGWNFGFGFSHSGYNLHASHQQIHQQYAMIPKYVRNIEGSGNIDLISSYSSGDLVKEFVTNYRKQTGKSFFENYLSAINCNTRIDEDTAKESSLIVFEDENILLFVPKAQTSQFELQLIPRKKCGNILEADLKMRKSIDRAILISIQTLENLGARMVTSIEFAKAFDLDSTHDQSFLYSFLPKMPMSPGAFSEAQLRWITGHYPEDFAFACRRAIKNDK